MGRQWQDKTSSPDVKRKHFCLIHYSFQCSCGFWKKEVSKGKSEFLLYEQTSYYREIESQSGIPLSKLTWLNQAVVVALTGKNGYCIGELCGLLG